MKFVSYLSFASNCREAFEFYAEVLGGETVAMTTHGETAAGEHVSKIGRTRLSMPLLPWATRSSWARTPRRILAALPRRVSAYQSSLMTKRMPSAFSTPLQKAAPL